MVCSKCEKKLSKSSSLACTDVWRSASSSSSSGSSSTTTGGDNRNTQRKIGENKLLSSKARYTPYAGSSKGGGAGGSSVTFGKCEGCKVTVSL